MTRAFASSLVVIGSIRRMAGLKISRGLLVGTDTKDMSPEDWVSWMQSQATYYDREKVEI